MRKMAAILLAGSAALIAQPLLAADPVFIPPYVPPVDYPQVDHGLKGAFYLRGSVGGNFLWAPEVFHPSFTPSRYDIHTGGWGYSAGIGAGYESGDGWRTDATLDVLWNHGMAADITGSPTPGDYSLNLRSTIGLANIYYDFGLGEQGLSAAGGAFGYVGAGLGLAFNEMTTDEPGGEGPYGSNLSLAAAGMAGVGYDFGAVVADLGYRALYINRIENTSAPNPYSIDNALVHEVRGTLRYRF